MYTNTINHLGLAILSALLVFVAMQIKGYKNSNDAIIDELAGIQERIAAESQRNIVALHSAMNNEFSALSETTLEISEKLDNLEGMVGSPQVQTQPLPVPAPSPQSKVKARRVSPALVMVDEETETAEFTPAQTEFVYPDALPAIDTKISSGPRS